jgi:hypothetical protein
MKTATNIGPRPAGAAQIITRFIKNSESAKMAAIALPVLMPRAAVARHTPVEDAESRCVRLYRANHPNRSQNEAVPGSAPCYVINIALVLNGRPEKMRSWLFPLLMEDLLFGRNVAYSRSSPKDPISLRQSVHVPAKFTREGLSQNL